MSRLSEIEARLAELRSQQEADKREMPTRDTWAIEQRAVEDLATLLRLVRAAKAELHSVRNYLAIHVWDVGGIDAWLTAVDEETTER